MKSQRSDGHSVSSSHRCGLHGIRVLAGKPCRVGIGLSSDPNQSATRLRVRYLHPAIFCRHRRAAPRLQLHAASNTRDNRDRSVWVRAERPMCCQLVFPQPITWVIHSARRALTEGTLPCTPDVSTYVATHGSPWNYDRRVPILFYRPGVAGFEQALPIETVDILPTLAALIELPVPSAEIDGRCIDLDAGSSRVESQLGARWSCIGRAGAKLTRGR